MKIALVRTASNMLHFGGYNIQEIGLAKALLDYGVSTDVYARFDNIGENIEILKNETSSVIIRPLKGIQIYREIMYYPSLKKDLCNNRYDVVQLLDDSQMMLPFLFKSLKSKGIKTILWQGMYRDFPGKIAKSMQVIYDMLFARCIDKYSDLKIAKTRAAEEYLLKKKYRNIKILPVGLDSVDAVRNLELDKIVSDFKILHPNILLYIGAIEKRRNVDFIIDLFQNCNYRDTGLIIIGNGPNQSLIEKKIHEFHLDEHCLVFKNIPNRELVSVYEYSDIFLLPTSYEIYGMVVMEALYYGVPVISTPEAGPQTILENEVYGKCLPLSKDEWIKAINFYLINYRSEDNKLLRSQFVNEKFRWSCIAKDYFTIISDL